MALPKFASAQQAGVDPVSVQQLQDQNQKISEILSKIEMRLSNVTNLRSNMQMATYDAFGNNFLTRGMTQLTDSISESIESLFRKPEKEKKDPIVEQLEKHAELLEIIAHKSNDPNNLVEEDLIQLRLDLKHIHEADHADSQKQIDLLMDIKTALLERPFDAEGSDKKASRKRKIKKLSGVTVTADALEDAEAVFEEPVVRKSGEQPKPVHTEAKKATTLLQRILDVLVKTNKDAERKDLNKISTQEETLESMQDKNRVSDIEPAQESPKGDRATFLEKLFDKDLNLLGLRRVFRTLTGLFGKIFSVASPLLRIIPAVAGAFTAVVSLIKKIPFAKLIGSVASAAKSLLGIGGGTPDVPDGGKPKPKPKTGPMPKGVGGKLASIAKGVGAAAVMTGAVMGVDYVAGQAGVGGNEINESQDSKNWERASTWEKVQSAPARAVEGIGSFIGLDNLVNQAKSERIANETKYLDDKAAAIERAQKEADKTKRLKEPTSGKAPAVNVSTSTTNNQTIIPMRATIKNQDDSFNRYLSSILK